MSYLWLENEAVGGTGCGLLTFTSSVSMRRIKQDGVAKIKSSLSSRDLILYEIIRAGH